MRFRRKKRSREQKNSATQTVYKRRGIINIFTKKKLRGRPKKRSVIIAKKTKYSFPLHGSDFNKSSVIYLSKLVNKSKTLLRGDSESEYHSENYYVLENKLKNFSESLKTLFKSQINPSKLTLANADLLEGYSAKDLKRKFLLNGSKKHILDNIIEDYKKGNLSSANLAEESTSNIRRLDNDTLNTIITDYQTGIMKNKDLNAAESKKKCSLTGSSAKPLDKHAADFKNGKLSATGISVKSFNSKNIYQKKMRDILKKYKETEKGRRRISFLSLKDRKNRSYTAAGSIKKPVSKSWHKSKSAYESKNDKTTNVMRRKKWYPVPEHPRHKKNRGTQTGRKKRRCCKRISRCICKIIFFSCKKCCRFLKRRLRRMCCPCLKTKETDWKNFDSIASRINVTKLGAKLNVKILNALKNYTFTEVKRKFSIKGSKVNIFDKMIDDFKTGKLTELNIKSNISNIDVNKIDKQQVNEILENYERMQKRAKENEYLDADELKEQFNISGSKAYILDEFVADLRKENPSVASLALKRKFDPDNTDKKQMHKILTKYAKDSKAIKKRIKENENLDADELKKKFSLYGSRAKIFDLYVDDLKKGKKSIAGLPVKSKFDPYKVNREQINKILNKYAERLPDFHKVYEEYRHLNTDDLQRRFSISSKMEMLDAFVSRFKNKYE